jgi:uncharacterized protein YrzB (UPF0473 family)
MEDKKMLTIVDENGNETQVEVLIAFGIEATQKEYVIYTMNEKDENGNITIYASALKDVEGVKELGNIETEEEWEKIKEIIREISKEN